MLALLALAVVRPPAARAATIPYRTDGELVALSDRVVYGRVIDVRTEPAPRGIGVHTVARIAVIEDLTGHADPVIEVRELGGQAGNRWMYVPGAAEYRVGEEVFVLLERRGDGALRSVAMSFAVFTVAPDASGAASLQREASGAAVLGRPATEPRRRTLQEFRTIVGAVKGTLPVRPLPVAPVTPAPIPQRRPSGAAGAPGPVVEAFTLLGTGFRWHKADLGQAVAWFRNSDRPAPVLSGNGDVELQSALTAWTAPASASIVLTFGGVVSGGSQDIYCSGLTAGRGVVSYEDPYDELASGTLAVGGGCGSSDTRVVNGHSFQGFSHGFVIFNDAADLSPSYRNSQNFARVLEHEVGHGIGLGHTQEPPPGETPVDIMYRACCYSTQPLAPAIGPDDLAGITFIYPVGAPTCSYTVTPTTLTLGPAGTTAVVNVNTAAGCAWTAVSGASWILIPPGTRSGPGQVSMEVLENPGIIRSGSATIAGRSVTVVQQGRDSDGDELPDDWETQYGLDSGSASGPNGRNGDPDGDGISNFDEYQNGTHPRGFVKRYLAEGSTGLFQTTIAIANPSPSNTARVLVRFQREDALTFSRFVTVAPQRRATIDAASVPQLASSSFSTVIESDITIVADRTMTWDATGYGSHAEASLAAPALTWYLAEGATHSGFDLYYLIQNPGTQQAEVEITYLLPTGAPLVRNVSVKPNQRFTDHVNLILPPTDVSAVIRSTNNVPIVVERAMYKPTSGTPMFGAGHGGAGVNAPATRWFLAEGATGPYFDMYVLVANPNSSTAHLTVNYLLQSGQTITKTYAVAANSRRTIEVESEHPQLANVSLSVEVVSDTPVIVERAMWWPGNYRTWHEAHTSAGATSTGERWAMAGGEVGGPRNVETYVLVANTSATPADVRVTLLYENRAAESRVYTINARTRFNVNVRADFPGSIDQRFGVLVESVGTMPAELVVERAMYSDSAGVHWAAGTDALATILP